MVADGFLLFNGDPSLLFLCCVCFLGGLASSATFSEGVRSVEWSGWRALWRRSEMAVLCSTWTLNPPSAVGLKMSMEKTVLQRSSWSLHGLSQLLGEFNFIGFLGVIIAFFCWLWLSVYVANLCLMRHATVLFAWSLTTNSVFLCFSPLFSNSGNYLLSLSLSYCDVLSLGFVIVRYYRSLKKSHCRRLLILPRDSY